MATLTATISLVKPDALEYYDLTVWNGNMDIIDEQIANAKAGDATRAFLCKTDVTNQNYALSRAAGDARYLGIAATAAAATKLATARTITLQGDVQTVQATFDGSGNISFTLNIANDSHTHDTQYYGKAYIDDKEKLWSTKEVTVSITDANYTLSATENLYGRMKITGVLTAARTVTADNVARSFLVVNGTNQTLTVKTASGTGVAIVAGGTAILYNDGTNVLDVLTDNIKFATYAPLASPAFTGSPTAPTPATSDDSTKVATTAFVKSLGLGIKQNYTTYTVGTDRVMGSTYTNSSDTPIEVHVQIHIGYTTASHAVGLYVDGILVSRCQVYGNYGTFWIRPTLTMSVPPWSTYKAAIIAGTPSLQGWWELR